MATQNGKNFVDSVLDTQKKLVDSMIENTKKVTSGNNLMSEVIEKGNATYNEWAEKQKNAFAQMNDKAEGVKTSAQESVNKANEFAQNWLNNQINWTKQAWEMNQNFIKNNANPADNFKSANPADWFNNMNQAWANTNNWMNQANQASQMQQQWFNMMQQFNPANLTDTIKKSTEGFTGLYNQYNDLLKQSFSDLQENIQNATSKDVYSNLVNAAGSFGKFSEMWAPFWKSIQDKSFSGTQFKSAFDVASYKEMQDKFFGFVPEQGRQYFQQATEWWNNGMKGGADFGKTGYSNMRDFAANMNPFAGQNVFEGALNGYQQFQNMFQNAVAPIAKMVTPNQYTQAATAWADIADRIAIYNIKNSELQYMMYQQGNKVMDKLVESVSNKIENGTEINSMTALYQEWLNIGDKVYVELFESDDYSKLMAEVSALQLKLRKDIDLQSEKMLTGIPVATKSELDELYKVIYDLKKEVRQLEKMLDLDNNEDVAETTATKAPRKSTTTKK
jgi:polyhydroxyalkanoate synthesis regulator phasin